MINALKILIAKTERRIISKMRGYGLDSFGSEWGQVMGSCEHGKVVGIY
jgi:hypothetical protein